MKTVPAPKRHFKCWNCHLVNEFEMKKEDEILFGGNTHKVPTQLHPATKVHVLKCIFCGQDNSVRL